jgi:hypothetical protein
VIALLLVLLQGPAPTVGDTVWVTRTVRVPPGAVLRPAPWPDDAEGVVQPLGAPVLQRHGDSVDIRYALVAWAAGEHQLDIPGPALIGPGAATDSLPAQPVTLFIASVIPDSVNVDSAAPQPPAATVGGNEHSWTPLLEFALLGIALGLGFLYLGRRRLQGEAVPVASAVTTADPVRWAQAGELRAAQATALAALRAMVARAVPSATPALDTASCLAVLRTVRPDWPLLELEGLLLALEAERFAPGEGDPDLVDRADALRVTLERLG